MVTAACLNRKIDWFTNAAPSRRVIPRARYEWVRSSRVIAYTAHCMVTTDMARVRACMFGWVNGIVLALNQSAPPALRAAR